jgi:hypothetical protein
MLLCGLDVCSGFLASVAAVWHTYADEIRSEICVCVGGGGGGIVKKYFFNFPVVTAVL